ncbi:MAG: GGDEF domain-containing protein [Ruminococcus sp.]|uniref:GGDEF domain-containing protein n=1 Tax=Ruminococcus sp. TaxID=41978 RepID=UPI0025E8419E|nr:GGDEF domain-containing protein [Ruminococcus sp.]MBR5683332.1 GGDEF domain-containing protein [Ruminococcus sp.]
MDFKKLLESFDSVTCIMSVEKKPDGGYGDIRIVDGNKAYIDSIERNGDSNTDIAKEKVFVPNSLYTKYFPLDLNFEDFCYRSAVKKEVLHTYVHPGRYDIWFNLFFMPVKSDDENIGYCTYTYTITLNADSELMSNIPLETASNVLQACIKLYSGSDFQTSINDVTAHIRKLCNANRCCILLTDFNAGMCRLLSDDHIIEGPQGPITGIITPEFFDIVSTWPATIDGSDYLMIKNEQDMLHLKARNPAWYESLKQYDTNTLVLFPLNYGNETKGYIWVTDFDVDEALNIRETLELTTYFISYAIANYQLLNRLEIMSTIDLLTGVKNRNAMNNRVNSLVDGKEPYPADLRVIFADLNGLKQVNDNQGHIAGDLLLKNAALILQDAFIGQEIYRAGGDEFTVFVSGLSDEDFEQGIAKLRSYADSSDGVSFAVGFCCDEGRNDIRYAMATADERMYADKEEYYKRHPERRHK